MHLPAAALIMTIDASFPPLGIVLVRMSPRNLLYFICRQIAVGTLGAIGRAFPEVGLCAQEAVQRGPSSILRLQVDW